ncbi:hypothetical protein DNI29_14905 [Hymenobacter sediminis]|uniref:hypothetical protein n=1 Tax=Hymenobacter sediminis TaxID=2218621 RepID=UPI000DA693BA|nr:hypothetical protein [Hymenobacter sediminis]RPD46289.1 hypothetical protein DNI29_14905 [Hymenobacter sediminis]
MHAFRSRLAFVLLLCFVRVLLPDAWVLALHQHEHTIEEPTRATTWPKGKALLSAKHQHCDADQFFKSSFEPAPTAELTTPADLVFSSARAQSIVVIGHLLPLVTPDLRGPPGAC